MNIVGVIKGQMARMEIGVWSIKRKSGESPELVAQFNGIEKFTIQLSSYCTTTSWRDYWEKDAFFLKFNPGPQSFGIGNTGMSIFKTHWFTKYLTIKRVK